MTALRLADPDTFVDGVPHEELTQLRRSTPVAWQEIDDQPGFWALLRHADIVSVSRQPNLFSAREGGVVIENLDEDTLAMMRMMLLAMDPPEHNEYRQPLAEAFRGRIISGLEPRIREITRDLMTHAAERDEVEFVGEVAAGLPTKVIGELMGLPEKDWLTIHELAQRQTSSTDPEFADSEPDFSASVEMAMYAMAFAADRRQQPPRDDLTSLILGSKFAGEFMSDVDFGSFFVQLVTAGNDTTTTMLSSGLWALLSHPDQLSAVRQDQSLIPGAVEEVLRWANPLHYFRRTATADTQIADVDIKAGDKVAMYYTSANRDEAVFEDSQQFDIRRHPNPHLSFGIGEHFCLGVHLARLEGRVFFEELLGRFDRIALTGDPIRLRSNLNNSFKSLPITLSSS